MSTRRRPSTGARFESHVPGVAEPRPDYTVLFDQEGWRDNALLGALSGDVPPPLVERRRRRKKDGIPDELDFGSLD